jgi:CRISPR-associated protein Cas6/Csy4, subtype I-F/YPEST
MQKPIRYYFMIRYLPDDADYSLLAGRCISTLHGFKIGHQRDQIGITFPSWSTSSIGNTIGFVSQSESALHLLKNTSYFNHMQEYYFFENGELNIVPDNCEEVMFVHNRTIGKLFVGDIRRRLARAKRRAEARGEIYRPQPNIERNKIEIYHSAFLQSKTTGQDFLLHIQKRRCNNIFFSSDYSGYGFATNQEYNGSVPELCNELMQI